MQGGWSESLTSTDFDQPVGCVYGQCRKFEGNLAEASASRSCGGGSGGLLFIYLFLHLAEAAASAASMQFTALTALVYAGL